MHRADLFSGLGISKDPGSFAVIAYHPLPGREQAAGEELEVILKATLAEGLYIVANSPNMDPGSRAMLQVLETYRDHDRVCLINGLARPLFVNLLRHAAVLLGNSSMGPLEAASVPLAAIDIGPRQKGRLAAGNVVPAEPEAASIRRQIREVRSEAFQATLSEAISPYGDAHSVERIVERLLKLDYRAGVTKASDPLTVPFEPR